MNERKDQLPCGCERDLDWGLSRREFVRTLGVAAAGAAVAPLSALAGSRRPDGPTPSSPAETAVARFYKSLKDDQKKLICFPFDHENRGKVGANWKIVEPTIKDLNKEQQALCQEIFKNLVSEEGYGRFEKQMGQDYGGFLNYHVAVFGEPGTDKPFEWVLSGRHNTMRADGNSVEGLAFGGPIFYGHDANSVGTEDAKHTDNVWWYQGQRANEIFASLDEAQRKKALVEKDEGDSARAIRLKGDKLASQETGLCVSELDDERKKMVKLLIKDLFLPFRVADVEEANGFIEANGGVDAMRLTYFQEGDLGEDGTWDIWKVEGPAFSWFFHGSPHVHTWLNVAAKA